MAVLKNPRVGIALASEFIFHTVVAMTCVENGFCIPKASYYLEC